MAFVSMRTRTGGYLARGRVLVTLLLVVIVIAAALPAPARAAMGGTLFMPETGHTLSGTFREYWERNGGLYQFGLPLSEPFSEISAIDGKPYLVQYFERAVFEEHPEARAAGWGVQLRLLGVLATRSRANEAPFRPVTGSSADRWYFASTAHAVDDRFRSYWESSGGLPIFGYPISEAFSERSTTDGQPYLVQYFERYRVEYHPQYAGTPYEFQLGLLGRGEADARGLATTTAGKGYYSKNIPLNFHRQMTNYWCDPADIQSWTEYLTGTDFADDTATQSAIWDYELSNNLGYSVEEWDASPYAMAAALKWLNPDQGFNHFIYDDPLAATKALAYSISAPRGQPAIAVIRGGTHYILVKGVVAEGDPYANYPNANIIGVYVSDPLIGYPSTDGKWLGADTFLTLDEWLTIFVPNTWGVAGDAWQGKYVTVQADWDPTAPTAAGRRLADFQAQTGR